MLFDVGRASGTKVCRLYNLVEIELSSLTCVCPGRYIEFLYFSVKR